MAATTEGKTCRSLLKHVHHSCDESLTNCFTDTADSNITESPNDTLSSAIRRVICGDDASDPLNALLYNLIEGNTPPALAAADLLTTARKSPDIESYFSHLTAQIISLASQYPLFHPDFVSLIASIMYSAADFSFEIRASFVKVFSTGIGDLTQSNYGHLFEAEQRCRNPRLGEEHINLNRFIARLLSALGEPRKPGEGVTQVQDALFILSTALEDHASSHKLPNVDIPAAAQYMIHAGGVVFSQCEKGSVRLLSFPISAASSSYSSFIILSLARDQTSLPFLGS